MRDVIGVPPVHPVLLAAGKAGFGISWALLVLRLGGIDLLGVTISAARLPAALTAIACAAVIVAALVRLDDAARVGLPPEHRATRLKTTGLYAISRNPVYVAALLGCLASCVYVPHPLNILASIVAAVVHHRIVRAEEQFLERRFGSEWLAYRAKVRRYF